MPELLLNNLATLAIAAIMCVLVALAVRSIVRRRKKGGSCCGDCQNCGRACKYSPNEEKAALHERGHDKHDA